MSKWIRLTGAMLRSSLLWGGLASLGFYTLIHNGTLEGEFFARYFTAHWCLYAETIMFFVGGAELLLRAFDLAEQRGKLHEPLLGGPPAAPQRVADVASLLARLRTLSWKDQNGYLGRRLREALEVVERKRSADTLDDDLKYLSEVDAGRAHAGYAFVRIIIWAIPILGFLGTVIGITMAIASLDPKALEGSLNEVTKGLGVAFDTTALALTLSMILMFGQFLCDRLEGSLLGQVDERANAELTGRFEVIGTARDPHVSAVQHMAEAVIRAAEELSTRQAEVWKKTIDAAHRRWSEITSASQQQIEAAVSKSLSRSIQDHAELLAKSEGEAAQRNRRQWGRLHRAMVASAQTAQAQHAELVKQGDILLQVVQATGQVAKLEDALNGNLAALAGAQHFQETLLNLSAAIHLLHARLSQLTPAAPHVGLKEHPASKAA